NSQDHSGKRVVLNIFPSLDTGVCAASVRKFNELAAGLENTTVLCVSNDLPFAQARFCGAEGIENVVMASGFRSSFGKDFGVTMVDGPLAGLLARSVVVLDEKGTVTYTQLVDEITTEPDYDSDLSAGRWQTGEVRTGRDAHASRPVVLYQQRAGRGGSERRLLTRSNWRSAHISTTVIGRA
ncbi:Peroxiredoxin, partial [Brevibacterium aurantiacum]